MPEIMTDAEAVQLLASMEVECEECLGSGGYPGNVAELGVVTLMEVTDAPQTCGPCSGSGKVRRFPGLSRECGCQVLIRAAQSGPDGSRRTLERGVEIQHERHGDCGGSGLIPVPIPDAAYWLMGQPEFWGLERERDGFLVCWGIKPSGTAAYEGHGPTIIQAFALAIAEGENG